MNATPLEQLTFDAAQLSREHPPEWHDGNKRLVYGISSGSAAAVEGELVYARWSALELPEEIPPQRSFTIQPGLFDYAPPKSNDRVDWYLNFSDPHLFVAYSSPLLAQDELQVAEHPILGSLREALLARELPALTEDNRGQPTPVTVTGAQRRCAIDTQPSPAAGFRDGLYGNAFARASEARVRAATTTINPPTLSNILAIAAPPGGYGCYSMEDIHKVATTAYTGFLAARIESERLRPGSTTTVNTGFWGCGAFGGNRKLMTILQNLAADLAGVDVIYWAFDQAGVEVARQARQQYEQLRGAHPHVAQLLQCLVAEKFQWGVSDGN